MGWRIFDSDAAAWLALSSNADVRAAVAAIAPGVLSAGCVDRVALRRWVAADPRRLRMLERVLHPHVRGAMAMALRSGPRHPRRGVVCEVPLLFELGWDADFPFDLILVVDAATPLRQNRALRRPGVDHAAWRRLDAAQTPTAVKRRLADSVIQSGLGRRALSTALRRVLRRHKSRGRRISAGYRRALGDAMMRS